MKRNKRGAPLDLNQFTDGEIRMLMFYSSRDPLKSEEWKIIVREEFLSHLRLRGYDYKREKAELKKRLKYVGGCCDSNL